MSSILKPALFSRPLWSTLALSLVASLSACSTTKAPDENATGDTAATVSDASGNTDSADGTGNDQGDQLSAPDAAFGTRRAPLVKSQPFQSEGRWMNAFYFVRDSNESWAQLSEKIYGRTDRADLLERWNNAGTMKVGRVVYYNSALRPEDSANMKVFAEDYGVAMNTYQVKKGDSLSAVAQELYGNFGSWKELAAINGIQNADLIQPGQSLSVQPAQVDTRAVINQVIAGANSNATQPAAQVAATSEDAEVAQLDQAAAPEATVVADQAEQAAPASPFRLSSDLLMKLGIGIVLIALMIVVVRKRIAAKRSGGAGWNDKANVAKVARPKTGF